MPYKKPSRRQMESLCADVHADDGSDPKHFFRPDRKGGASNRKTLQLCSQVADTLCLVLSGECGDEVLQSLQVLAVKPGSDASHLLVFVAPASDGLDRDPTDILRRLNAISGRLRSEIAAAITRKRTPRLVFQLVSAYADGGDR